MEDLQIYWIWLQEILGYGNSKILTIKRLYDKIEDFYNSSERDYKLCGCFTPGELRKLSNKNIDKAVQIKNKCIERGYKIITYDDEIYSKRLKQIYNPPCVLYVWGDMEDIDNQFAISIVGTRKATAYGLKNSYEIAYNLASCGTMVISGGALGIDSAAHRGALEAEGKTICVLGCGIDYSYLKENEGMRKAISKNGAVISEYPPGTSPSAGNFPMRNRIISGLSLGTVIIEAGEKSGSLITAGNALQQNREVFALLGSVSNSKSNGTNSLIKNGLAIPITDFKDILKEFDSDYIRDMLKYQNLLNNNINQSEVSKNKNSNINTSVTNIDITENETDLSDFSDETKLIYNCIGNEPVHIDDIAAKSNLSINIVLQAVTELELSGLISTLSGRRYIRN